MSETAGHDGFWTGCGTWAEVLLRAYLRERGMRQHEDACYRHLLTPEEQVTLTGADRPLTHVLLRAALHHQVTLQHLGTTTQEASALWLHTPDTGGVDHLLRYTPYAALQAAPAAPGEGCAERAQLLEAAQGGPDGHLLWHRIRTAAAAVVDGVVGWSHESVPTMRDVLLALDHQAQRARIAEAFGSEVD